MEKRPALAGLSPGFQLMSFFGISMLGYWAAFATGQLILKISGVPAADIDSLSGGNIVNIDALMWTQIAATFCMFLLPAVLVSYFTTGHLFNLYKWERKADALNYLLAGLIIITCALFVQYLILDHNKYVLPTSMHEAEDLLKKAQDANDHFFFAIADSPSIITLIIGFVMVAVLPPIAEEFFFRGALQHISLKLFSNIHLAILFCGLTFGLFHFELYNFLAISFMGVVLGYLYFLTGNMWVNIFAHFLNNALTFLLLLMHRKGWMNMDPNADMPWFVAIPAGIGMCGLLYILIKRYERRNSAVEKGI